MQDKKYPAKLLLFGEYTVILGSRALAMPFPRFFGRWKAMDNDIDKRLLDLLEYIKQKQVLSNEFNINELELSINKGYRFDANIPLGYGLGSSGALCAAIYDLFAVEKKEDLEYLKGILADLESHFHGSSSGVDPLICYLQKTVLLKDQGIEILDQFQLPSNEENQLFLLDIGFARKSGNLINWFMEQCKQEHYRRQIESLLLPAVENCIVALLQNNTTNLLDFVHDISHFQSRYFQPMIPASLHTLWLDGLSSDWFKLKLCGAGGGGFFMGVTSDLERLQRTSNFDILPINTTFNH
ncbi:MAG: hypothetical protein AAFO82_03010 [Bacteroidota bacterium]